MTSRRQDFLSTAVEQLRYHVQKLESAATHMMAACALDGAALLVTDPPLLTQTPKHK